MKREIPTLKATGQQGSWFTEVEGFGSIPVIHNHWFDFKTMTYHHPNTDFDLDSKARAKIPAYITALRTGRYVATAIDKLEDQNGFKVPRGRKGYVAVWQYDAFVEDDEAEFAHSLRMVDRVAHLK
jgi:hypothetical protein